MAKGILDIVIQLVKKGDADKETIKGLANLKNALSTAGMVAGVFTAAAYGIKTALDAVINPLVAYADQVRRLGNATGMGTEDASRLIQVLDDMKISYEDLEKAVTKNGKTYDYSVDGLARMSDEYLKLSDSQEQAAFMQERFGKNWITFVPAMQRGGDALREAARGIADNMVLTEQAVREAREYEIAVDDLTDAWTGFKYEVGNAVLPALNDLTHAQEDHARALEIMRENGEPVYNGMRQVSAAALEQARAERDAATAAKIQAEAMDDNTTSAEENAKALDEISKKNTELLGLVGRMQSEADSYTQKQNDLTEERTRLESERAELIKQGWWEGSEKVKDYDVALEENAKKTQENAKEHLMASRQIILGLIEQKLAQDGLTTEELNFLLEKGQAWGLYSDTVINEARDAILEAEKVSRTINDIPASKSISINVSSNYADVIADMGSYFTSEKGSAPPTKPKTKPKSGVGGHVAGAGYAGGTGGWLTVPSGYPNDSYPVNLSSGEQFAVVPPGGGVGGNVSVSLQVNSPVTIMDEQRVKAVLLPYIVDGIRQAQARGAVR